MFEKFISRFAQSLLLRLFVTGTVVTIPVGFTTSWLGAAYLSLMLGANFLQTLLGLMIFGWPGAMLPGLAIGYVVERWLIRDKASTSWKWVIGRILLFMLLGFPEGAGTLISIRVAMREYPSIVESIYFVQTITCSFVLGILYTLVERVMMEIQKRESKLKTKIEELRIEIDQMKRQKHVDEITGSEFFQDLKEKAASMRQRSNGPAMNGG